mgnify:CR=1 FL=1
MKKLIFPIVCCFISVAVSAQLIKPKAETQKKQSELDWFNCSFDQDSVYGAEVNKAYDYLKAKQKESKEKTGCCTDRNRNGRRARRPETRNLDKPKRKIKSKR